MSTEHAYEGLHAGIGRVAARLGEELREFWPQSLSGRARGPATVGSSERVIALRAHLATGITTDVTLETVALLGDALGARRPAVAVA